MQNKPKHTIEKVINKAFITIGIKLDKKIPVYYKWDKKRQPINKNGQLKFPFIMLDYEPSIREWSVSLVSGFENVIICNIDDITGFCSISSLDNID